MGNTIGRLGSRPRIEDKKVGYICVGRMEPAVDYFGNECLLLCCYASRFLVSCGKTAGRLGSRVSQANVMRCVPTGVLGDQGMLVVRLFIALLLCVAFHCSLWASQSVPQKSCVPDGYDAICPDRFCDKSECLAMDVLCFFALQLISLATVDRPVSHRGSVVCRTSTFSLRIGEFLG